MLRSDYSISPSNAVRFLIPVGRLLTMRQTQMYRLIEDSRTVSGTVMGELIFSRGEPPLGKVQSQQNNPRPQFS